MKTLCSIALVATAATALSACGVPTRSEANQVQNPRTQVEVAASPASASETDTRIESSFNATYVYRTYLENEKIDIRSDEGKVTLSGSVNNADNKPLAEYTAEALPGVTTVDNQIEITGAPSTDNSDAWIRSRVGMVFFFHRNVSASRTEIKVADGIVTLRGEAENDAQRDLTTEYAKGVSGVTDVRNEMTVSDSSEAPAEEQGPSVGEQIDDASITAQAKISLLYHRSTSGLKTGIDTKDGVVTLSGEAKNAAEKELAARYVSDIHGVKSVVNTMTIGTTVSDAATSE